MSVFATDPAARVLGRLAGRVSNYHVPDKAAIEAHIRHNRERIERAGDHAPRTVAHLRYDIDLLLARWLYLHEVGDLEVA